MAVAEPPVLVEHCGAIMRLTLNRPKRHNALGSELIDGLRHAVQEIKTVAPAVVVIAGAGRSFSTGGDVAAFLAEAEAEGSNDAVVDYAQVVVGALHDTILGLLCLDMPVIARVQGAVTGGSAGLVLAADMVAMTEDAFLQPWYAEVGFGPDGGWTALLPDRIGTARAIATQALNRRIGAMEALGLGLATRWLPLQVSMRPSTVGPTRSRGDRAIVLPPPNAESGTRIGSLPSARDWMPSARASWT